jgi:hypothetical protein
VLTGFFAVFQSAVRADMENRVGGAFSWNTGVSYVTLFQRLDPRWKAEVEALYKNSGASLEADLTTLNAGTRIAPDNPAAIAQMDTFAQRGDPQMPILTMHTTGDNIVFNSEEPIYYARTKANHDGALLRQTYVSAPGHCNFSASEQVSALLTMNDRLATGSWPATSPAAIRPARRRLTLMPPPSPTTRRPSCHAQACTRTTSTEQFMAHGAAQLRRARLFVSEGK